MSEASTTITSPTELSPEERAILIASQNDSFRKSVGIIPGDASTPEGTCVMTRGVSERSIEFRFALMEALRAYDGFNNDCDPHGWHEMGVLEIEGETVWFKIDLYDVTYNMGAEVPEDPNQTRRVLTLLFPSEY